MPTIFDNIENHLGENLKKTMAVSYKADFCVGYFNLRGWKHLTEFIDSYEGNGGGCCRLLIGMQRPSEDLLKQHLAKREEGLMDNATASVLKKKMAADFRQQLMFGIPTEEDEQGLRKLAEQLKSKKVIVKLFLKHTLHAKLYLLYRQDDFTPLIGYLGSSNLTLAGLQHQGELNIDVLEQDAARKLERWFNERWNDRYCIDITDELANIIDESWAGERLIKPYYVYLKTAYHLSQEAQLGLNSYLVPSIFKRELLPFQQSAVSIAARHLDKRGGVIIGDVVGLGKTLTACALAKVFEETFFLETLVICPKNLVSMWEHHLHKYEIRGKVKSISMVNENFLEERRYRLIIIDESHNLRNREGKRYGLVREYIKRNESKVILLTATPYNKTYHDISNQLRLFLPEDKDLGVSPERFIEKIGGPVEFVATYQYSPNSLLAFEKSDYSEDWRELLKLYMVRRTRTFIKNNYAELDENTNRYYLEFISGDRFYFPERMPKKIEYDFDPSDPDDVYARMYSEDVVNLINQLDLPRYGLGNFINSGNSSNRVTPAEQKILNNLSKAGKQLMGFCRTNLFKRLESSGYAFLLSLSRHVMRNMIFLYAIDNDLPLPIGSQETDFMNEFLEENDASEPDSEFTSSDHAIALSTDFGRYQSEAGSIYQQMQNTAHKFQWISSKHFTPVLREQLQKDSEIILEIMKIGAKWDPQNDKKINALESLLTTTHRDDKLLIFSQFADTVNYLGRELVRRGIKQLACVTGDVENPTEIVKRFSPRSNGVDIVEREAVGNEIRVLLSTDILSEGQNLQDAHIIVNFDLPWALIRLIQRAGRVDRIGQKSSRILCYSFLPADGVEKIINLRGRLANRIKQNAEVVGSDEIFFDGDPVNIQDLYNEKAGILDEEDDNEVDLTSTAYEIWNQAVKARPELKNIIPKLPNVIYATKQKPESMFEKEGVITYHKTPHDIDVLTWLDRDGRVISKNQMRILKALECDYNTPPQEKLANHHALVEKAVEISKKEEISSGGQLGKRSGARYKTYMRLNRYYEEIKNTLLEHPELKKAIDDIYKYPLRESAKDLLNRRFKLGIDDQELASLVVNLREEGRLCIIEDNGGDQFDIPQIITSMGIRS
ncbi:MAG TPA: NgoFVII family restriction endonuclease [Firmicutes bacterium]|jgi:superfamily II DNA or RNA helicase|nr:NgoFVII family restriction endonuclease [Bacillota bacterium]